MNLPRHLTMVAAATLAVSVLAACGDDANDAGGDAAGTVEDGLSVIDVEMTDMAFAPASIDIKTGETVRLRFHNAGLAVHEAVIGDLAFQEEHAEEMTGGSMHHGDSDEPEPLVVAVGETGDLVYTAATAGTLIIGCHQPGHWDAGMRANLSIT
jgi:uncharacterized cupredoxin-like copper-binding protein